MTAVSSHRALVFATAQAVALLDLSLLGWSIQDVAVVRCDYSLDVFGAAVRLLYLLLGRVFERSVGIVREEFDDIHL